MNSGKFSFRQRLRSFSHAFRGLWWLLREEHNAWIYLAVVAVLIPVCLILRLNAAEWIVIILCISLVFAMELVNSAIERLADRVEPGQDPLIGRIKDLSAAAVLVTAAGAAITALIILVPKL